MMTLKWLSHHSETSNKEMKGVWQNEQKDTVYEFAKEATTKHHNLSGLKHLPCQVLHSKVLVGLVLWELWQNAYLMLLPSFW